MANSALLSVAGVLESLRNAIVNGEGVSYNKDEVLVLCVQAIVQLMCGGSPTITLPKTASAAGVNDDVIARFCSGKITATPFIPGGANFTHQTAVAADGGTTAITFPNAFPTSCTDVLCTIRDYSGSDNAALTLNIPSGTITKTGFSVIVGGGQSGSTCTVTYFPVGT